MTITGCDSSLSVDPNKQAADPATIQEAKKAASEIFELAHEEFFAGMTEEPSRSIRAAFVEDAEPEDCSFDDLSLKDHIIGEAMEAYYSGDTAKVEALLKENGLYERYLEIAEKYDLEAQQETLSVPSGVTADGARSVSSSFFDSFQNGDVFLCYGGSSSSSSAILGLLIPGHWKHAGLMDRDYSEGSESCILSASNQTTHGFGVGFETRTKWVGEYAVSALRVKGRTDANGKAAVEYGKQYLGRDFSFFTDRNSNSKWYCSKLVWRSWKSQGKDLEYNKWYHPRGMWVLPTDIFNDGDVYPVGGDRW